MTFHYRSIAIVSLRRISYNRPILFVSYLSEQSLTSSSTRNQCCELVSFSSQSAIYRHGTLFVCNASARSGPEPGFQTARSTQADWMSWTETGGLNVHAIRSISIEKIDVSSRTVHRRGLFTQLIQDPLHVTGRRKRRIIN